MEISVQRRRRIAIVVLGVLAVGAFALGASLHDSEPPQPSAASQLTPPQLVGQRLVVGFEGTSPPAPLRRMVRRGRVAGVILFAENLPDRASARRLTASLQAIPRPPGLRDPLLIMVDQEGGEVKRLAGAPTASARQMGAVGSRSGAEQGAATAGSLRSVGVNVDLAPVLDIARPGSDTAATERGFGADPAGVTATAIPFATALRKGGVAATAKHFPGLGGADQNTDVSVQRVELSAATLRRVDETPFRAFIDAGGELVMVGSAIYPALSPLPAAFAPEIATAELRGRLGFEGVSITDALGSAAIADFGGPAAAGVAAARAGMDLLLFTDYRAGAEAGKALLDGLRSERLRRAGFEASVGRVLRLRHRTDT